MIALLINALGTTLVSFFTASALFLAIIGPAIEKVGFFPAHIWEAIALYRIESKKERKKLTPYLWRALCNGSVSLIEDVLIHDPLYILLFLGLSRWPGIPVWLISSSSFIAAVIAVAWLEVGWNECRYAQLKKRIRRSGFEEEHYLETRFLLDSRAHFDGLIAKLTPHFNFQADTPREYRDLYFETALPHLSSRKPLVRVRCRTLSPADSWWTPNYPWLLNQTTAESIQVVYGRPQEENSNAHDQFRFYLLKKDKFYLMEKNPPDANPVQSIAPYKNLLRAKNPAQKISFRRMLLHDPAHQELAIAMDSPLLGNLPHCIIEVKAWRSTPALLHLMRLIMRELPAIQTTMSKTELGIF